VSRYKADRSLEFVPGYKVGGGHWRSVAVQFVSEPEICQVAGFKMRAYARIRVQRPLLICLGCRSKSKKCDKQLTFIVRVIASAIYISILLIYFSGIQVKNSGIVLIDDIRNTCFLALVKATRKLHIS